MVETAKTCEPPVQVAHLFTCGTCGASLEYFQRLSIWFCPRSLGHGTVKNADILDACAKILPINIARNALSMQQEISAEKWREEDRQQAERWKRIVICARRETCTNCMERVEQWVDPHWYHGGRLCLKCEHELDKRCTKCGRELTKDERGWRDHLCGGCWR